MSEQYQNNNANENEETEIDLREVFGVLWHRLWILVLALIIGGGVSYGCSRFIITPLYSSSSMIYILTKTTSITSLTDLQMGSQLTVDFQTLATSRPVVESVIQKLNLNTTYEKLVKTIKVENPQNTRILKTTVTNKDPALAMQISNAMSDAIADQVANVMTTDKPTTVEQAVISSVPSSPHVLRNTAAGALIALLIAIAAILIRHFMDDTIKTDEDVEKYLNVSVIAAFPIEKHGAREHTSGKSSRKDSHKKASA